MIVSVDEILGNMLEYRDDKISQLVRLNDRFATVFNEVSNKVIFGELSPDVLEYLEKYAGFNIQSLTSSINRFQWKYQRMG